VVYYWLKHIAVFAVLIFCGTQVRGADRVQHVEKTPDDDIRVLFPQTQLFVPLLADPREERFSLGIGEVNSSIGDFTMAQVNVGERFGLFRRSSADGQRAGQFGLSGGIFSVFDLDTTSWDLVTTDFLVSFTQELRRHAWTSRIRLYHQSSHLGDEFVIHRQRARVNFSYESLEALTARSIGHFRIYGGGQWMVRRFPDTVKRLAGQFGLEYRGKSYGAGIARPVIGIDLKSWEQHGWDVDASALAGIEWVVAQGRSIMLAIEGHTGHAVSGQFFLDETEHTVIGVIRFAM
jgi:Protein of unknown function (DUF1207)